MYFRTDRWRNEGNCIRGWILKEKIISISQAPLTSVSVDMPRADEQALPDARLAVAFHARSCGIRRAGKARTERVLRESIRQRAGAGAGPADHLAARQWPSVPLARSRGTSRVLRAFLLHRLVAVEAPRFLHIADQAFGRGARRLQRLAHRLVLALELAHANAWIVRARRVREREGGQSGGGGERVPLVYGAG